MRCSLNLKALFLEAITATFLEDTAMLEAQRRNMKERPQAKIVNIVHDTGPTKLLKLLDRFLAEEAVADRTSVREDFSYACYCSIYRRLCVRCDSV